MREDAHDVVVLGAGGDGNVTRAASFRGGGQIVHVEPDRAGGMSCGTALERVGDPRELGDAVAFLSSARASFITGTALPVDGGSLRG